MLKRLFTILIGLILMLGQTPAPTPSPTSAPPKPSEGARLERFYYRYNPSYRPLVAGIDAELTEDGWIATFSVAFAEEDIRLSLTDADVAVLERLVDDYDLKSWTGFHESNAMMLDGESFSFSAGFEGGFTVDAYGNNSFPKGYLDVQYAILTAIEGILTAHDVSFGFE